jgi:transaldolase
MDRPHQLRKLGQSLWLDNITRELLDNGGLRRYVEEYSVTGLTSNPTIFERAIGSTGAYDADIREKARRGLSGETLFSELALKDLVRASDLFLPIFTATDAVDGWVSMEVSPLLVDDSQGSVDAALRIHAQAERPNLFVKIPGTPAGLTAIEESIFAGVPINVTLLFSCEQYIAAAEAYFRGIERRIAAGLDPRIDSVASLFVSRWDNAVIDRVPAELRNRLGIAVAARTYRAYRELLASSRWHRLAALGVRPQRLLWASTGTKDPTAPETLYVEALAAPDTINTMPEKTLRTFAEQGVLRGVLAPDGGDADTVLARFEQAGVYVQRLATQLQREGKQAFIKSWQELMRSIAAKSRGVSQTADVCP